MKNYTQNRAFCALLAMLLCLGVLLTACNTGGEEPAPETQSTEQTTAQQTQGAPESDTAPKPEQEGSVTEPETETEIQTMTYTVSVTGSNAAARQGAVVRFYLGEEQVSMVSTGADGTATAELPVETYTVVIDNILGETYDTANVTLSPETPALSVKLYALPSSGEEIYAYQAAADDYVPYQAGRLGEGVYMTTLTEGDMTYFLFVATRDGVFRIAADESLPVSIGYYGSTSFVLTSSAATEENNAICLEVYEDMVNNYAFVIGVRAEEADVATCVLRVEYVGEREMTPEDMPWTDVMPQGTLSAFQKPAGTVRPFDVTSTKVQAVYNPEDGYYHLNAADGAVLMLNLSNNSPYLDALITVCDNMRLGVYVYDEQGNFVSKDSYNELLRAYAAVADGGYYPLDATLANAMQVIGAYIGWYDASSPMYLFAEQPLVVPENAWLFACAYVQ